MDFNPFTLSCALAVTGFFAGKAGVALNDTAEVAFFEGAACA